MYIFANNVYTFIKTTNEFAFFPLMTLYYTTAVISQPTACFNSINLTLHKASKFSHLCNIKHRYDINTPQYRTRSV